jgi:hypothetical protein
MTIFRCSPFLMALLIAGCDAGEEVLPDAATPLGKIARVRNFEDRRSALKSFAESRIDKPADLKSELLRAGFRWSKVRDDAGAPCDNYVWDDQNKFMPVYMIVNVCGRQVTTNAGQTAP